MALSYLVAQAYATLLHRPLAAFLANEGVLYDNDGLLNEFKLMWAERNRFPLHLIVFKQTACHLPHEANVEMIFSRAGLPL